MAEQFLNSFIKGLNKDMSTSSQPNSTYRDARNIRITTDTGRTNGAVINAEGNEYSFSIPIASSNWEIISVGNNLDVDLLITITSPNGNIAEITATGTTTYGPKAEKLKIVEHALRQYQQQVLDDYATNVGKFFKFYNNGDQILLSKGDKAIP